MPYDLRYVLPWRLKVSPFALGYGAKYDGHGMLCILLGLPILFHCYAMSSVSWLIKSLFHHA